MNLIERKQIGRAGLARFLDGLAAVPSQGVTLFLAPGEAPDLDALPAALAADWTATPEEVRSLLVESETGAGLFWGEGDKYAVVPPLPLSERGLRQGWDLAPLRAMLARQYLLGVVLLRLSGYSVGVFQGDTLLTSKTGSRYVKGKHKAGGWSQQRFARIREKQARELVDEACEVVRAQLESYTDRLDYVFLGGDRFALLDLVGRCPFLQSLAPRTMKRRLNVRFPKRTELEDAPREIWKGWVLMLR